VGKRKVNAVTFPQVVPSHPCGKDGMEGMIQVLGNGLLRVCSRVIWAFGLNSKFHSIIYMTGATVALCQTPKFSENYQIQEINRHSW